MAGFMAWFTLVFPPWLRPPRLLESRGAGEVAVGHRRVQRRGEELEVAVPANHRVQAQVHPVATMAFQWIWMDFP